MLNLFTTFDMVMHKNIDKLRAIYDHKKYGFKSIKNLPKINNPSAEILLGNDLAISLVLGKPIPWVFANYILKADKIHISKRTLETINLLQNGLDTKNPKYQIYNWEYSTKKIKNLFPDDDNINQLIKRIRELISQYDMDYGVTVLGNHIKTLGEKSTMESTRDEACYAIAKGYPMLTTQFTGIYSCDLIKDYIYPTEEELIEENFDEIKIGSDEHQRQIKAILTKLEQPGQAFYGFKRIQEFPLNVEPYKETKVVVGHYDDAYSKARYNEDWDENPEELDDGQLFRTYNKDQYKDMKNVV